MHRQGKAADEEKREREVDEPVDACAIGGIRVGVGVRVAVARQRSDAEIEHVKRRVRGEGDDQIRIAKGAAGESTRVAPRVREVLEVRRPEESASRAEE